MKQALRRKPAECVLAQHLAGASGTESADDRDIEFAALERSLQRPRRLDPEIDDDTRMQGRQPAQHRGNLGADSLFADADGNALAGLPEGPERSFMRRHQLACGRQEALAFRRQPHQPRMPLQQSLAQPVLQPPDPRADERLRGPQRLGGAGETVELSCLQKGCDGVEVQGSAHDQS